MPQGHAGGRRHKGRPVKVYLSLGSNLGDRLRNLEAALALLAAGGCRLRRASSVYETAPLYYLKQPAFFNMAAACETSLSPAELLALIGRVEAALRRRRLFKNGPRTIDIDILFYGGPCPIRAWPSGNSYWRRWPR